MYIVAYLYIFIYIYNYIYANPNETSCTPPDITRRLNSWNLPSTSSTKSGHADIILTPTYHNLPLGLCCAPGLYGPGPTSTNPQKINVFIEKEIAAPWVSSILGQVWLP